MRNIKEQYTVDEAAEMLGVDRTTLLILLSALRTDLDPHRVKKIRTRELERMYGMLKQQGR